VASCGYDVDGFNFEICGTATIAKAGELLLNIFTTIDNITIIYEYITIEQI